MGSTLKKFESTAKLKLFEELFSLFKAHLSLKQMIMDNIPILLAV